MNDVRIVALGDSALAVQFEQRIAPEVNAQVTTCAATLAMKRSAGVRDIVPAFRSITVYFDPLVADVDLLATTMRTAALAAQFADGAPARPQVPPSEAFGTASTPQPGESLPTQPAGPPSGGPGTARRTIEIPVCYDPDFALDMDDVCRVAGLEPAQVIALHAATVYRVYMLGFVPGFAYLGQVDPRIATPRRPVPRTAVARGSVGIAGSQTGVYPRQTAGGWNIIGRTPLPMVSLDPARPARLAAGDHVRFRPIDRAEFDSLLEPAS